MVPFLGLDRFDPVVMNDYVGWNDDLHLTLISLITWPIKEGLEHIHSQMENQGLVRQLGSPWEMDLDGMGQLVLDIQKAGEVDLAGELQKIIFKVQLYDVYRHVDGRDQVEMEYWTSDIDDETISPLFLSAQAALDRIDYLTPQEALDSEADFVANQLESIDVLYSLPEAQIDVWQEERMPMRHVGAVGAVRRLESRRRGIFPPLAEVLQQNTMDDAYQALVAHGQGQLGQYQERESDPGFTKATFNAMLVGDRGIGKSSIIASIFDKLGMRYAIFNAATMDPYLDLVGLPYVDETPEGRVSRTALPQTLAQGVDAIFIDELNRASMPVQNALMQIILEGKVNDQVIPGLKLVWAAINPPQTGSKNYGVQNLNWALEGRFTIYQLPNDVSEKYFLSRKDLTAAFGEKGINEVISWWRDFQKKEEISADEKAYLDPRTLDNILTQIAGAKRRDEDLLIGAVAKSLTRYPTIMDELGRLLATQASTQDAMLDVMAALNDEPENQELVVEFSTLLSHDPEGAKTVLNDMARYLYGGIIEEIEDVDYKELLASEYFNTDEVKEIVEGFFTRPKNAFFAIWLGPSDNPTFQNIVNYFYGILATYGIPMEDRGAQLLTPIRSMWRIEALLINAAITYLPADQAQSEKMFDLIFQVLDPSIFETDFNIEELGDMEALIKALPSTSIQEDFSDPVAMVKRNLIWALEQVHSGKQQVLPHAVGATSESTES